MSIAPSALYDSKSAPLGTQLMDMLWMFRSYGADIDSGRGPINDISLLTERKQVEPSATDSHAAGSLALPFDRARYSRR